MSRSRLPSARSGHAERVVRHARVGPRAARSSARYGENAVRVPAVREERASRLVAGQLLRWTTDENQGCPADAFDGIWGDSNDGSVAEASPRALARIVRDAAAAPGSGA